MKALHHILLYVLLVSLSACSDFQPFSDDEDPAGFEAGEAVTFTTNVPAHRSAKRSLSPDADLLEGYSTIQEDYALTIKMYEEGQAEAIGTATYKPKAADVATEANKGYDESGLLEPEGAPNTPLHWPTNQKRYAFEATAGTDVLETDQSTPTLWLAQDRLHGYAYMPLLDDTKTAGNQSVDRIDALNYHTNKEWGAMNKVWKDAMGEMLQPADYKHIPLFLQHQRAWITVILKAGEGVKREALHFDNASTNIRMAINSFTKEGSNLIATPITEPLASEYLINYEKDANGEAQTNVSTTRYDAIVEPYNYGGARKEEDVIAKINLSDQHFSFYAGNDNRYINGKGEEDKAEAAYNLEAGKHLTIEVTLSRESRKILITAWVEDWTEVATSTICDDYGQNGTPTVIKSREELIAFLTNPKTNRQGSVGIIQPVEMNLDAPGDWTSEYDLNATLNLAGCTLSTKHRLFNNMSSSANLLNGTVLIGEGAEVDCAIAKTNDGTIERVNVETAGDHTTAKATLAGMVGLNHGTIYRCTSTLPVYGVTPTTITDGTHNYKGYVGGIAAVSVAPDGSSMAVIDGCTVNAAVNGSSEITGGGGIVGYATGRVSNNTFEYGMTVRQEGKFKNIFATAGASDLRAYGNAWPTKATNPINGSSTDSNPNTYGGQLFDAVIDCQQDLAMLMTPTYNNVQYNYRISKSFTVESSDDGAKNWSYGTVVADDLSNPNNAHFNLDGNDKTITLTGTKTVTTTTGKKPGDGEATNYTTAPMLFNYVLGEIKNLTLFLEKSVVAGPSVDQDGKYDATDAIAPLAYAVYGPNGKLTNIKVKGHKDDEGNNDVYVQAATPAGLVVWAYGGATITGCKVQVPVRMWLPDNMGTQSKHYAGGLVACAEVATIRECSYYMQTDNAVSGATNSPSAIASANNYYGGIVGGTSPKGTGASTPCLLITDCSSWFNAQRPADGSADRSSKGAIIGYTCYATTGSTSEVANGMSTAPLSEGNWWPLSAVGANYWASGLNEEKVIGKRNSVTPNLDTDF